jgi:hypothetical protein
MLHRHLLLEQLAGVVIFADVAPADPLVDEHGPLANRHDPLRVLLLLLDERG